MNTGNRSTLSFEEEFPYGITYLSRHNKPTLNDDGTVAVEGSGSVAVASTICPSDDQCPYYHRSAMESEEITSAKIHFLIASYRDQLCSRTLDYIFRRAKHPERIFVRILDQNLPESDLIDDVGCFAGFCADYLANSTIAKEHKLTCEQYKKHIHTAHVHASQAKGVPDGRSKLSAMIHWDYIHRNDPSKLDFHPVDIHDFCFQIDSHSDFADDYDTSLVTMFHRTKNDYAVLSTYPHTMSVRGNALQKSVVNLCLVTFPIPPTYGSIRIGLSQECLGIKVPKLTNAMHGGGLSFHRCHAELNVPDDPYMDHVFNGNEMSRGIRLFSHGYDIYSPDQNLVFHDYLRHPTNKHAKSYLNNKNASDRDVDQLPFMQEILQERHKVYVVGLERVDLLLGIGPINYSATEADRLHRKALHESRFGWGPHRTPEQAQEFTGINFLERRMEKNKCGNLLWVPYVESPNYGIDATLQRPLAGPERGRIGESQREAPLAIMTTSTTGEHPTKSSHDIIAMRSPGESCFHPVFHLRESILVVILATYIFISRQRNTQNRKIQRRGKQTTA
jgi:hypothetical protein